MVSNSAKGWRGESPERAAGEWGAGGDFFVCWFGLGGEEEWSWLDSEYGGYDEYWAFRKLWIFEIMATDHSSSLRRKANGEQADGGAEGLPAELSSWDHSPPIAVTGDSLDQRPPCLLSCKSGS